MVSNAKVGRGERKMDLNDIVEMLETLNKITKSQTSCIEMMKERIENIEDKLNIGYPTPEDLGMN